MMLSSIRNRTAKGVISSTPFGLVGACCAGILILAQPVEGAVINENPGGEPTIAEIFSEVLGGTFIADGDNFTNGTIQAVRVSDDDDQLFSAPSFSAELVASFARLTQEFGVIPEGGSYQALIPQTGDGYDVSGSVNNVSVDGAFAFARADTEGLVPASSVPADNSDGADHMATFRIEGADGTDNGLSRLFLFFEDRVAGNADFDYNDMVVDVTLVPEPASFALMALGLLCMAQYRRPRWVKR